MTRLQFACCDLTPALPLTSPGFFGRAGVRLGIRNDLKQEAWNPEFPIRFFSLSFPFFSRRAYHRRKGTPLGKTLRLIGGAFFHNEIKKSPV